MQRPNVHQPIGLEALEPRALFSTYLYNSLGDAFDVGRAVLEIGPPDGAVGFGTAVVGLGDLNSDGHDDFAVSAPGDAAGSPNGVPGSVFVYSGQNGSLLRTLTDGAGGFGMALANVGDLNDDGVDDLLVGSPWTDATADAAHNPTGAAYVYSGADGSVIFSLAGTTVFGEFGRVVGAAHDVNDDGTLDMVVGAPAGGTGGAGQALVLSGADFSMLHTLEGETPGERFGASIGVSTIENIDVGERIFVGAPAWGNSTGRVYAFSSQGTLSHTLSGVEEGERFGASLNLAWRPDFVLFVGAPGADGYRGQFGDDVEDRGRVDVFAASQTTTVGEFLGRLRGERLGEWLGNVGRLTGADSADELAVGSPGDGNRPLKYLISSGGIWSLRSGPGAGLYLTTPDILASAIAPAGDVNNDGFADVVSSTTAGGGRVTIVNALALSEDFVIRVASPDHSHTWMSTNGVGMLGVNGTLVSLGRIPGLPPFANIQALFNDGAIVYYTGSGPAHSELMLLRDGVNTPLSERVTTIVGGETPTYDRFSVAAFNAAGDLALHDLAGRAWVFRDGTLTYIWHGTIADINAGGAVVGHDGDTPSAWFPVGGAAPIEGLERVGAINDMGEILGVIPGTRTNDNPGTLGVWRDGVVTEHSAGPQIPNSTGEVFWVIRDFADDGSFLADADVAQVRTSIHRRISYMFTPEDGLRPVGMVPFGRPDASWSAEYSFDPALPSVPFTALGPGGSIISHSATLNVIDDALPFTLREDGPVTNLEHNGQSHVVGVNIFGDVMLFTTNSEGWSARRLTSGFGPAGGVGIAAGIDRTENGGPYVVIADYDSDIVFESLYFFRLDELEGQNQRGSIRGANSQAPIVGALSVFTNAEGIMHVAGVSAAGDVVLYYRNPGFFPTTSSGWNYTNLTADHLAPQSLATPRFQGELSSFATGWSAMHINGLDEQGNVHSIWWAPGQTLWRIDSISAGVPGGAGPLHGQITSFATSWGTLHVNGVDSEGALVALWWAPGFGGEWRRDALVPEGIALDASSLTSYTTPWGGLNIAGRDATTNQVVVYWWSPESNVWTDEPLSFRDDAANPALAGRLAAHVSDEETMAIAGVGADNTAFRFSWQPGDAGLWALEDLTVLAS